VDEQMERDEAPQADVTDRRAILEQSLEAAERGEPIEPVARDNKGRFATPKAEEPADEPQANEEPPVWKRPPASWKKDFHEVWQKADPKMQEYAWQREEQMRAGVEPLLSKAQFADAMQEAISPYMQTIQGLGLTPDKAVAALMDADHKLRNSDPQAKLQYFAQLAQSYGINLGAMQGQPAQQGQAAHFEDVRPAMIQLLQSGMAQTLDEAYEKAIRLDPNLFEQVSKAQQAEIVAKQAKEANKAAKAARAAAVSVRSATPGVNTAPKAANRRALLEEAFSETESRL